MAKLEYSQFYVWRDLMPNLINYTCFNDFMEEQKVQTLHMLNCQSLRVEQPMNGDIVAMNDAYGQYVDDDYFRKCFNAQIPVPSQKLENNEQKEEHDQWNSYPVKTIAVEVGWILSTAEGFEFLRELNQSESLDLFECETI